MEKEQFFKRSKMGVSQVKKYMKGIGIAAALFISIGGYAIFHTDFSSNKEDTVIMIGNGSVIIPTI